MPERNGSRGAPEWPSVRSFSNVRRFVQEREGALGTGQVGLQAACLSPDSHQRRVELREVAHHEKHLAQSKAAGLDMTYADEKNSRRSHGGGQTGKEGEAVLSEDKADTSP